jgi:DNA-binding GntR family transcriptional regulator
LLLTISPTEFRRLEPYLPRGLVADAGQNPLERAAGFLMRMVLTQQLHPGQKVPMDAIAERVGSSRTPVREALRLLETEGLVASIANRGFVVRRLDPEETRNLYDARRCVESYLARVAWARRDKPMLADLRALHRIYAQLLGGASDRRRLGMLVDKAFHLRIAHQGGNPYLAAQLANVFDRLILTRPIEGFPVNRMGAAVREHGQILAAFESGSAKSAVDAITRNIDNGSAAIVEHLQSLEEFSFQ